MSRAKPRGVRSGIFNVLGGVVLLVSGPNHLDGRENLPYRFTVPSHSQVRGLVLYKFVDLNGDAVDEIISIAGPAPGYVVQFFRWPGELIQKFNFDGTLTADSTPLDLDNDGITNEYFVSEQIDNRVTLFALWPFENRAKEIFSITGPRSRASAWECSIHARDLIDVNGDGKSDLIVYFKSNAERPRGVMAIDLTTSERIWHCKIACGIRGYVRIDLDEDSHPEILLATESLNSKARTDSTNDKQAYLMILDSATGSFRYLQPRGGSFTKTEIYSPAEFGLPAHQFVVVVVDPQQSSFLELWDWRLRKPVAQLPIPDMKWHFIADVNRDQKQDLIFLDRTGSWQAVDVNLQRIRSFPTALSFPPSVTVPSLPAYQIPLPMRLPGTSRPGIVAQFSNRAGFIVFDDRLQPVATWEEGMAGEFRLIRRSKHDDLFWSTADHVYFLQLNRNSTLALLLDYIGTGIILTLEATAVALVLWFMLQRKKNFLISRMLQALQSLEIGCLVIQHPDRVLKANRRAREILNLGEQDLSKRRIADIVSLQQYAELLEMIKNGQQNGMLVPQRCELHQAQTKKEIEVLIVPVKARLKWNRLDVLFLRDVTEQYAARKATFWAKTAQKLAHDLKNPLSSILMVVDHLQREYGIEKLSNGHPCDEYIGHIRSEVARMRKHTIGFVKFADLEKPNIEPVTVNELLHAAVSAFEPMFGDRIQLNQELEENLPRIAADAKQMRIALNNLIDNAISAMSNGGTLTLRTYLVSPLPDSDGSTREYVAIEIQDTGFGIPPEILERIREQQLFVTTKPDGTGVGLVQVQEIISDHRGQFEVNSTPGVGTMVYMAIPIYLEG